MKVLVYGASGFIGSAVTRHLVNAGHDVYGLARSNRSQSIVTHLGATSVRGDMAEPSSWWECAMSCDAVIQVAAAFEGDMAASDHIWVEAIIRLARERTCGIRVLYTGGCWLFPARTEPAISEDDAFDPLPPFHFMVEHRARLLGAGIDTVTIHPGMVWSHVGGCTSEIIASIKAKQPVAIVESTAVRWPLVHVEDLAALFVIALGKAAAGDDFFAVTDPSVPVADIIAAAERVTGESALVRTASLEDSIREKGGLGGRDGSVSAKSERPRAHHAWLEAETPFCCRLSTHAPWPTQEWLACCTPNIACLKLGLRATPTPFH